MPIGTSNGQYFEDAFDQAHTEMFGAKGTYDPKTDTFVADTEPTPKEIYFVRHGDTDLNKEGEKSNDRAPVRGWNDTPLNEQGRADAQKAADKLAKEPITHIVTSDLPRASDTAKIIGDKLGITPEEHPGLRTWNLGEYTGKTGEDVHDAVDRLCLHTPDVRPPGGESFNEFKSRILSTFGEISKDHAEHEVLVVSHNSPERILNAWDKAGQPASGEIDRKQYHSDDGSVQPGQHKKFTIKDPSSLLSGPTFEERFQGQLQQPSLPMMLGWQKQGLKEHMNKNLKNYPWMHSPSDAYVMFPKDEMDMFMHYPNATPEYIPSYGGKEDYLRKYYNRDIEKDFNYDSSPIVRSPIEPRMIADIENSIESLAQKHGVEGSKLRDIITDIAKHPTDYISPMPGEMGIMSKIPIGKEILQTMRDKGMANHEIAKELGVSVRTVINRLKEFGISKEGSPIQKKQKLTPRDPNYTTNIPDWFLEEMNDKEDKAIREWMKNQFEGAPIEPTGGPEHVAIAAIRHPDTGKVYTGEMHGIAIGNASEDYPGYSVYNQPWEEGFVTNTGRFVDRREAGEIAVKADQIKPEFKNHYETLKKVTGKNTALISEDLKNNDYRYTPKGDPQLKDWYKQFKDQ